MSRRVLSAPRPPSSGSRPPRGARKRGAARRFLEGLASVLAFIGSTAAQAAPDALRGEQVYARCQACHALAADRVGPHHCGLFGRLAGSVPGFNYSPAMKNSKIVWDKKTLDLFLAKPLKMVPGTAMTYDGVPDEKERADLIAYLQQANLTPECKK